ncbi:inhibitor of growth protein 3 isoform X3 [Tursiops truncatus]|uniref:inhibitor of growth protein 3 isoform X3 n=1 Tax=Tursiops truncatus TaxID=9739 RepID=UPI003CCF27EA
MLYLEDYLEMIEQLPMDLRDRFTEMREMDLQVQNAMDQLEQRVSEFFMNAKKNKPEWREEQMASIKKDYYKALEDADEKVQLANQIYDLALDAQAQQPWLTGPAAPWHVESSRTGARTRVTCIGRRTPNHCATREAHNKTLLTKLFVEWHFLAKNPFVSTLYINVYKYNGPLSCLREMYV